MKKELIKIPELLVPAGSWEQFTAGMIYGADAFYLSTTGLSLRAKSHGFTWEQLTQALTMAHAENKKVYFCLNLLAQERHLKAVRAALEQLADYPVDGIIIADPGIIGLAQKALPKLPIHLSTQSNSSNSAAVDFWQQQGIERVNLARELDYKSLRAIRENSPKMELEVFVHGAMCMAISGRCLMSSHLNQRSANLGMCTNPCRFKYKPQALILEESQRPGQPLWELEEDENYSHIFAAEDLCLVRYLNWFVAAGIDSVKLEGRTKSGVYAAQVIDVYKTALQDVVKNRRRLSTYMEELQQIGDRDFSSGFFLGHPKTIAKKQPPTKPIFARILQQLDSDKWQLQIKTPWHKGAPIQVVVPGLLRPQIEPQDYSIESEKGVQLDVAHPGTTVWLRAEQQDLREGLFLRL